MKGFTIEKDICTSVFIHCNVNHILLLYDLSLVRITMSLTDSRQDKVLQSRWWRIREIQSDIRVLMQNKSEIVVF